MTVEMFVTFGQRWAKTQHPVEPLVHPDAVIMVVGENEPAIREYVAAWLGMTGVSDFYDMATWRESRELFPRGAVKTVHVPAAEFYAHPQGKRITIFADGVWWCHRDGKKATTSATPAELQGGHYGTWYRVFRDAETGRELTADEVAERAAR